MKTAYINAEIYDSESKGFYKGSLICEDGLIVSFDRNCTDCDTVVDLGGKLLAPGLVDVHTHGRAGADFISADSQTLGIMARSYIQSGVTSVMPTLASAPLEELKAAILRIAEFSQKRDSNFCGIHFEGRYLNPRRRGAHAPELLFPLDAKEFEELIILMNKAGNVHISAALELDIDGAFSKTAIKLGATLSLAHTDANYAQAKLAFERGANALTHTYNTMTPLHHRDGGAVCAGLTDKNVFCEMIVDGFHVSPEMVKLAYLCKNDMLALISDSMEATVCSDGEYSIAGMPVTVKNGFARTHDGAIAGSTLSLLDGVKNLARFTGIPFETALYNATATPARLVGIYGQVGSIELGKKANLLVLDKAYNLEKVIFKGEEI